MTQEEKDKKNKRDLEIIDELARLIQELKEKAKEAEENEYDPESSKWEDETCT